MMAGVLSRVASPLASFFQLTTDNELCTLNYTGLGVPIGPVSLAALGQANDDVLLSNNLSGTQSLINTAVELSTQMNYRNVPSKTKILVTNPKPSKRPGAEPIPPSTQLIVDGVSVLVSSQATHLGIVRSCHHSSNSPALLSWILAHSRSLYGVLNLVMAKNHRTPTPQLPRELSLFSLLPSSSVALLPSSSPNLR